MIICEYCHVSNPVDSGRCQSCGAPLPDLPSQPSTEEVSTADGSRTGPNPWAIPEPPQPPTPPEPPFGILPPMNLPPPSRFRLNRRVFRRGRRLFGR